MTTAPTPATATTRSSTSIRAFRSPGSSCRPRRREAAARSRSTTAATAPTLPPTGRSSGSPGRTTSRSTAARTARRSEDGGEGESIDGVTFIRSKNKEGACEPIGLDIDLEPGGETEGGAPRDVVFVDPAPESIGGNATTGPRPGEARMAGASATTGAARSVRRRTSTSSSNVRSSTRTPHRSS